MTPTPIPTRDASQTASGAKLLSQASRSPTFAAARIISASPEVVVDEFVAGIVPLRSTKRGPEPTPASSSDIEPSIAPARLEGIGRGPSRVTGSLFRVGRSGGAATGKGPMIPRQA